MTTYDRRHHACRRIIRSLNRSQCSVTLKVHWLNLFAKFSVTERTAVVSSSGARQDGMLLSNGHLDVATSHDNQTESQKTVGCFILYSLLKKLEPMLMTFGHSILRRSHAQLLITCITFQPHVFTHRIGYFTIYLVENDLFSCHCQFSKHSINKDCTFNKIL